MITNKELIPLVIEEAKKLKKFASKKEINRLSFKNLRPVNMHKCIYGQLTGDCFSERANELVQKCTEKRLSCLSVTSEFTDRIADEAYDRTFDRTFSPIELFICIYENIDNGNNKALINYLKGKTRKLILK